MRMTNFGSNGEVISPDQQLLTSPTERIPQKPATNTRPPRVIRFDAETGMLPPEEQPVGPSYKLPAPPEEQPVSPSYKQRPDTLTPSGASPNTQIVVALGSGAVGRNIHPAP